jgi:hypothetical protein
MAKEQHDSHIDQAVAEIQVDGEPSFDTEFPHAATAHDRHESSASHSGNSSSVLCGPGVWKPPKPAQSAKLRPLSAAVPHQGVPHKPATPTRTPPQQLTLRESAPMVQRPASARFAALQKPVSLCALTVVSQLKDEPLSDYGP